MGRDYSKVQEHSEYTSQLIDKEIRNLLETAYAIAKKVLIDNKHILDRIALSLLEKETLNRDDFEGMVYDLKPFTPSPSLSKA